MNEVSQLTQYAIGFFSLLGIAAIIGFFKIMDWLISQKYVSHLKCEKCRGEIFKTIAIDHDLLNTMNGKIDILLECFNVKGDKK